MPETNFLRNRININIIFDPASYVKHIYCNNHLLRKIHIVRLEQKCTNSVVVITEVGTSKDRA
jgi:hypothetical protein